LIVGVATLARVGVSREAAYEAYSGIAKNRRFENALSALEGIVAIGENRRLHARHELYVRHIIENLADFGEFRLVIKAMLRTYLKYGIPIVRAVNRLDGLLFRFLLNHKVIAEHAKRHGDLESARDIYDEFEVEFQLDGHYWLQYGLYLAEVGELNPALDMLRRSIQAYPGNSFAAHALADIQLRIARGRAHYDAVTRDLVDEAVASLTSQDAQTELRTDFYPIVTLATGHIGALVRHGKRAEAKPIARRYFDRLSQLEKRTSDEAVKNAKEKMMRFVTLDEWNVASSSLVNRKLKRHRK
jgi:tetratricopeptide (TPR) repeat protein